MMDWLRRIARVGLIVLLPVLLMLFHNQLANWHYHVLQNGMVVKHAHPYNKPENAGSPIGNHKHSDSEFLHFGQFTDIASLTSFFILTLLFFREKGSQQLGEYFNAVLPQLQLRNLRLLRAPPALAII